MMETRKISSKKESTVRRKLESKTELTECGVVSKSSSEVTVESNLTEKETYVHKVSDRDIQPRSREGSEDKRNSRSEREVLCEGLLSAGDFSRSSASREGLDEAECNEIIHTEPPSVTKLSVRFPKSCNGSNASDQCEEDKTLSADNQDSSSECQAEDRHTESYCAVSSSNLETDVVDDDANCSTTVDDVKSSNNDKEESSAETVDSNCSVQMNDEESREETGTENGKFVLMNSLSTTSVQTPSEGSIPSGNPLFKKSKLDSLHRKSPKMMHSNTSDFEVETLKKSVCNLVKYFENLTDEHTGSKLSVIENDNRNPIPRFQSTGIEAELGKKRNIHPSEVSRQEEEKFTGDSGNQIGRRNGCYLGRRQETDSFDNSHEEKMFNFDSQRSARKRKCSETSLLNPRNEIIDLAGYSGFRQNSRIASWGAARNLAEGYCFRCGSFRRTFAMGFSQMDANNNVRKWDSHEKTLVISNPMDRLPKSLDLNSFSNECDRKDHIGNFYHPGRSTVTPDQKSSNAVERRDGNHESSSLRRKSSGSPVLSACSKRGEKYQVDYENKTQNKGLPQQEIHGISLSPRQSFYGRFVPLFCAVTATVSAILYFARSMIYIW